MKTAATLALDATGGARWIWMARFGLVAALALTLFGGCGSSGSTEKDSSSSADLGGSGDTAAGVDALEGSDVFANDLVALDLTIGDLSGSGDGVEEADLGSDGADQGDAHSVDHDGVDGESPDSFGSPDVTPDATLAPLPGLDYLDKVIDLHRGSTPVWASVIYVDKSAGGPRYVRRSYKDTGDRVDFWPASTIKVYSIVATLQLLKEMNVSLDATATFYHKSGASWVEDISKTFRAMIYDTTTCSSNEDYTLLLRFVGLDAQNAGFFTTANGFTKTALMRGYVTNAPYVYDRSVAQRIVVTDGSTTLERTHTWGGTSYADKVGCTVYNGGGTGNCSSTNDMAEFFRRVMLHELIPEGERYDVRKADLDWWRYGEPQKPVLNERTCTQGAWAGVKKVFPDANFYKKPGRVTDYAIDLHYVEDLASGTYYVAAIGTESTEKTTLESIAEEIARMMKTPDRYVYLASLKDNVNPVRANLWVYTTEAGTLDLAVAPQGQGGDPIGWSSLSGSTLTVDPGGVDLEIVSDCLDQSLTYDVLGRLSTSDGVAAFSDLHYVIVNSTISCP